MGKDKKDKNQVGGEIDWSAKESETLTRTEANGGLDDVEQSLAEQGQQVEQAAAETHRVEVLVAINDHHAHDKVTVAKSHPFYSGLLDQNLARVID